MTASSGWAAPAGRASTAGPCPSPASAPPGCCSPAPSATPPEPPLTDPPAAGAHHHVLAGVDHGLHPVAAAELAETGIPPARATRLADRSPPRRRSGGGSGGDQGEDVVGGDLLAVLVLDGDVPADLAVGL